MPKKKPVADVVAQVAELQEVAAKTFTEAELFYITEKSRTSSPEEIAETLKCTVDDVKPHIPNQPVAGKGIDEKDKSMMHKLMGGQSQSGKRGGMSVMTPPASQFSDATRAGRTTNVQGRNVECIHKPLG